MYSNVLNVEHVFVRYKLFVFLHYLLLFIERDIFGWNFSGGNSEFLGRQNFKVSKEALKQDKPFLTFLNCYSTVTVFLNVFPFSTVWANLCQKWIWNATNKSRGPWLWTSKYRLGFLNFTSISNYYSSVFIFDRGSVFVNWCFMQFSWVRSCKRSFTRSYDQVDR